MDGRTFVEFRRQQAQGASAQLVHYQATDENVARHAAAMIYYRLRQVDLDGTATYLPVQRLAVGQASELVAQAWPNPFDGAGLRVQVQAAEASAATLVLLDTLGRPLVTYTAQVPKGTSVLDLPQAGTLPEGVYWLRITQGQQQQIIKVARH